MLTDMPWQLNLLVAEALVSMVIALVLLETRTSYRRTPEKAVFFATWDACCIGLMIWAGNQSLQHFVYVMIYLWAIAMGLVNGFRRREVEFKPELKVGTQVFTGFLALTLILLITTG